MLLPSCTFYSFGDHGIKPLKTTELADISPVIYLILAIFCIILIVSVACALFRESRDAQGVGAFAAVFAALVILLLVG
jgi:membrane associated rhomboid family serine protease